MISHLSWLSYSPPPLIALNARELRKYAEELESQIVKIGRGLGTRCVASSFRSISAVWRNYEVLVSHFTSAKSVVTRDNTEKKMYEGLLKKNHQN
mgnify:CR=1 FL=1